MVLLNCALVGEGSVISIIIEEWKTVALLKKAIKAKKPNDFKDVDADKLQLFLAKTEGGAWLAGAGVAAVTVDGDGHPQGFELMDPTLWIKNPKHFGANFQPGEGQIHVLVVVPEQAQPQMGLWLTLPSGGIIPWILRSCAPHRGQG
ncbi:hypothetical protein PC113_g24700 [Phytophthora cactorum]|uniref:Crinkler effector protein N-terminal domain-containing protein n=1 Tax=Phytophthora cactorum TaxID=29920 RepID=A0A8T0Y3K1_9STRA|nr:hypothetical protein PC113_g24700 [Phytophthora cactorum]